MGPGLVQNLRRFTIDNGSVCVLFEEWFLGLQRIVKKVIISKATVCLNFPNGTGSKFKQLSEVDGKFTNCER
jgi:hypothetical protein